MGTAFELGKFLASLVVCQLAGLSGRRLFLGSGLPWLVFM